VAASEARWGGGAAGGAAPKGLLFFLSTEQRGLTFIVHGPSIGGIVMKIYGDEAVEVPKQTHRRFITRLDRVDALGIN
jgi:hypothetical protein